MGLQGHLTVEFPNGEETVVLRFSVSSADEIVLRRFTQTTKDVVEAVHRAGGLPAQLRLSYREETGLRLATEEPSDDLRSVILHRLRPLILKKEPWSFDRVCAIVRRSSDHPFLGRHLRSLRGIYAGKNLQDIVVFSRGELVLNSETAFEHWLNGFEYHREEARAAEVANVDSLLPIEAVRPIFIMLLSEKLKAITLLAYLVEKMLERPVPDSAEIG